MRIELSVRLTAGHSKVYNTQGYPRIEFTSINVHKSEYKSVTQRSEKIQKLKVKSGDDCKIRTCVPRRHKLSKLTV